MIVAFECLSTFEYGYDGFGNLTSKSGSGGSPNGFPSTTATYNAKNQLTTVTLRRQRKHHCGQRILVRLHCGEQAELLGIADMAVSRYALW